MTYMEQACDGCKNLVKLQEQIKALHGSQDKVDKMLNSIITLTVKFDENEKRAEKNSRVLWGVLTAVIAQGVAILFSFWRF